MSIKYSNFVRKTLTATVATGDLTIEVSSATGLPAITASDWFRIVVTRMSDLAKEIMKVTSVSGTTLTVVRAQEGTTALAFAEADRVENWITAGTLDDLATYFTDIAASSNLIANEALGIAQNANVLAGNAISTANGIASTAQSALTTAQTALDTINSLVAQQASSAPVPVGAIIPFPVETPPAGYLECAGQLVSQTGTYAALYAFLKNGTSYCIYGQTATHFYVPDLRGAFMRGWNHGSTTAIKDPDAASRSTCKIGGTDPTSGASGDKVGTRQLDEVKGHVHSFYSSRGDGGSISYPYHDTELNDTSTREYSTSQTGGNESRPRNVYVMFCIKF